RTGYGPHHREDVLMTSTDAMNEGFATPADATPADATRADGASEAAESAREAAPDSGAESAAPLGRPRGLPARRRGRHRRRAAAPHRRPLRPLPGHHRRGARRLGHGALAGLRDRPPRRGMG